MTLTDAIWQIIQRPSPAVTRDEIEALVVEWTQAPVADEEEEWDVGPLDQTYKAEFLAGMKLKPYAPKEPKA